MRGASGHRRAPVQAPCACVAQRGRWRFGFASARPAVASSPERGCARLRAAERGRIEALLQEKYADFGATLAAEKLLELDGIKVSIEMVRRIQIGLGLWRPKTRRARRVFQLRQRRPRFGELIQIDGSLHDWFEGRGPRCTLIVFIDDATGRLTALRFAPVESGAAYLAALRDHVSCLRTFLSPPDMAQSVSIELAGDGDGAEQGAVSEGSQ